MNSNETHSRIDPGSTATPKTVGEQVPDFELPGVGEDGIDQFELSQFTCEGALIISFYPFDFSPVCTEQLCGFRDAEWLSLTENVDVVGISVDSAYSHKQFRAEYDLPFPLLTDRLAEVADAFGVKYETWEHHPAVCQRAMFAVDDDHTIRYRWYAEDAREQPTLDDIQESIEWMR